jgi:hypothetical protein
MRLAYWGLGLLVLVFVVAGSAAATHYRYGTLSWEPTGSGNDVLFTGGQAWRGSAFGSPAVGQIVSGEGCISTGDGGCEPIFLKVNSRSAVNDYFSGTFVDASGNAGIPHTYATPNNGGAPWTVSWGSCCRISSHSSGNFHVNNPDQSESLQTFVDIASDNAAPRSTLPPINACPREAFCTIPIPAADREDDALAFRLASASEAGDASYTPPGPSDAPNAATVGASSGILAWDTHGATVGPSSEHTLYSVQVMIEDGQTQTPLDFFIEILPVGVSPPYWVTPPTPCGETLSVAADSELSFDVRAASDGPTRTVSVSHLGLPLGAVLPPVTPGNPASGTFTWTPTQTQGGSHLVVFAAEDDLGYPAPACPVTINVNLHPPPVFTSPATCGLPATVHGVQGIPLSFPVSAFTPNASRTVTITLESGPAGLMFPTAGPANPAGGIATWASPVGGALPARFLAVDDHGIRARCTVPFDIEVPMGQAFTLGAWAGTAVPVAAEYSSGGHDLRTTGADAPLRTTHHAVVEAPQVGLRAEGVTEWAGVTTGIGTVTSTAGSEIERLSLSNGAVILYGLHQEATVKWDVSLSSHVITRTSYVTRITAGGQDVPVAPGVPVVLPLPNGRVSLFETSSINIPSLVSVDDALVHVYLAPEFGRHEAILGSVILQGGIDIAFRGQTRDVHAHDDLRSGEDAGDDATGAMALSAGPHDANMPVGDSADAYVFMVAHGEKIVFVAQPAPGVYASGGSVLFAGAIPPFAASPALQSAPLELWRARLYDPMGALRVTSLLVNGGPARVELNGDITGQWAVIVDRTSAAAATNYSLALTISPVALLPQNDALALGDAAPECVVGGPGIPVVGTGLWPGVVRDDDFSDTYRFTAEIGELITVTLKPGEDADGAAMGIRIYDRDCGLLASMDQLTGLLKGETRLVARLPSQYTGDYYTQVVRLNGVANHYVDIDIVNPLPTVPMNDALTGQDAPADPAQAIAPPPIVFEGRIHEGDTGDAYRLAFQEGPTAFVGFSMSALSDVDVHLYDPNGVEVPRFTGVGSTAVVWRFDASVTGDHILVVTPRFAGGNYAVTWGQLPVEAPEP